MGILFPQRKKKETETFNKNGNLEGIDSIFDKDGIVYEIKTYKGGNILSYTFKDKEGNIVRADTFTIANIRLEVDYTPQGIKKSEGHYENNKRKGNGNIMMITEICRPKKIIIPTTFLA